MRSLAALAMTAMLYHCLNHAIFKSLLFLGTGSVLHATQERNLGKLGGLMRYMPWVAGDHARGRDRERGAAAVQRLRLRVAAAAELPVHRRRCPNPYLKMLVPIFAAGVALVAALAGYVMVKFFGVIFLGTPARGAARRGA